MKTVIYLLKIQAVILISSIFALAPFEKLLAADSCQEIAERTFEECKVTGNLLEQIQAFIGQSVLGRMANSIANNAEQVRAAANRAKESAEAAKGTCTERKLQCGEACASYIEQYTVAKSRLVTQLENQNLTTQERSALGDQKRVVEEKIRREIEVRDTICEAQFNREIAQIDYAIAQAERAHREADEVKWAARGTGAIGAVGLACAAGIGICKNKKKKNKGPGDDESDDDADENEGDSSGGDSSDGGGQVADGPGDVDCSDEKNRAHRSCAAPLERRCHANPNSEDCKEFTEEYCKSGTSTAQTAPTHQGSGIGTDFCQHVSAHNFCSQPGRSGCLSCHSLGRMSQPQCLANPMSCLPQVTNADLERVRQSEACASDPIYSNPAFVQSQEQRQITSPDSNSSGSVATADGDRAAGQGLGANSMGMIAGGAANALRGGATGGNQGGSGETLRGDASRLGARGESLRPDHVGDRTIAPDASQYRLGAGASQGAGVSRTLSSLDRGGVVVAAGVAASNGPSLFARASQIVRSECANGANNNCGPRREVGSLSSSASSLTSQ